MTVKRQSLLFELTNAPDRATQDSDERRCWNGDYSLMEKHITPNTPQPFDSVTPSERIHAVSSDRLDRFTAQEDDFEIIMPAPAKANTHKTPHKARK